jgi:hypothetical protein
MKEKNKKRSKQEVIYCDQSKVAVDTEKIKMVTKSVTTKRED